MAVTSPATPLPTAEVESHQHGHGHGPANRGRRVERTSAPLLVRFPRCPARAAVVVLHNERGLTDEVERACRSLAAGGYLAVAPLLYYQTGGPAFSVDDHPVAEKTFARLRPGDLAEDLVGTLHHLERRVGIAHNAIAMAGIGAGGHLAAWGAAHHRLFAALAVDLRPGPWSELPGPETPAVQLGERWLVRPDVAGVWDEAVGFFDTMFARRSR